ncbi:Ig-like domain-containing protein [Jejuia pallidilutea]|uniref:Ig-like domain-containing protein n=1 Tax=Jejuia pallidilutea TaxID=504487 RepID=UPI0005A6EA91|nr:Ig-like domain-containing protein [Jejuia pallidilutea]
MKYLLINSKFLITIFIIFLSVYSCNNEELYAVEENLLTEEEEEVPVEEEVLDVVDIVEAVNDTIKTSENKAIDFKPYSNDVNLPESILLSNTTPTYGTISVNDNATPDNFSDDTIQYIPDSSFSGTDSFEYEICDANNEANCDSAIVTIIVDPVVEEDIATELKAFPSAYGFAANATGGRGGVVLHVTNLNDSGPGSFREACKDTRTRTIVFDVSGTITLLSPLGNEPNCTIAGQTAPQGGITIRGQRFSVRDNTIIRYIRFRQDREDGSLSMSGIGAWSKNNLILDHCSVSYGRDESILFWDDGTKAGTHTIQRCIIAEGKTGIILGSGVSAERRSNSGQYSFYENLIEHMHRTLILRVMVILN